MTPTNVQNCQQKNGKLTVKLYWEILWNKLCVNLICPYKIRRKGGKYDLLLKSVTMVDHVMGWFEVTQYKYKQAITNENVVETTWLARFTWPTKSCMPKYQNLLVMGSKKFLTQKEYEIKSKPSTSGNPNYNSILEIIH